MYPSFEPVHRPFSPDPPTTAELLARGEQAVREAQEVCQATRDLIRVAEETRAQVRRAHDTEIRA
jgi:hypothetical protein